MASHAAFALVAGFLTGVFAAGELLSRFGDAPGRLARTGAALAYFGLNVVAGAFVYLIFVGWEWSFGGSGPALVALRRALLAGAVGYAPGILLLRRLLLVVERQVDRRQGHDRGRAVREIMRGVSFELAAEPLPMYCLTLLEGVTAEEARRLAGNLGELRDADLSDGHKALLLGANLVRVAGAELLREGVAALRDTISVEPASPDRAA